MKLLVLIPLLCSLALARATCPDVNADDIRQRFCAADLVFVGKNTGGMSSLASTYASMTMFFEVKNLFKGDDTSNEISIYRISHFDSDCDVNPFPRAQTGSLVLATRHQVEECSVSPPWECIPEALKHEIEQGSVDCSH